MIKNRFVEFYDKKMRKRKQLTKKTNSTINVIDNNYSQPFLLIKRMKSIE